MRVLPLGQNFSNTKIVCNLNFYQNGINGSCNSRALIGLATMVYEPLYHALQIC